MITNNITRLLESRKIHYEVHHISYEKIGAIESAQILQIPERQIFKSIVAKPENQEKPVLAVVPGNSDVDTKKLAKFLNWKKVVISTQHEAESLTGMKAGGISPLGLMQRRFTVIIDCHILNLEMIHISGGQIGLIISLPAKDLLDLTKALIADISKTPGQVDDKV